MIQPIHSRSHEAGTAVATSGYGGIFWYIDDINGIGTVGYNGYVPGGYCDTGAATSSDGVLGRHGKPFWYTSKFA